MKSPGRAPERRMAFPAGTEPSTTMSARMPSGDCAVSPPARGTENRVGQLQQSRNESVHPTLRQLGGSASERNAARGIPPMAAMSLSPRARQRWPTESGGCHSRRKCTSSRLKSVVTSASCPRGIGSTAQSSPMPRPGRAHRRAPRVEFAQSATFRLAAQSVSSDAKLPTAQYTRQAQASSAYLAPSYFSGSNLVP